MFLSHRPIAIAPAFLLTFSQITVPCLAHIAVPQSTSQPQAKPPAPAQSFNASTFDAFTQELERLYTLGADAVKSKNYSKAAVIFGQMLDKAKREGDDLIVARWHTNAGICYANAKRFAESRTHHQQAISFARNLSPSEERTRKLATTLSNFSTVCYALGRYEESIAAETESLSLREQFRDHAGAQICAANIAWNHFALGNELLKHGHSRQAKDHFFQALPVLGNSAASEGAQIAAAAIQNDVGVIHFQNGDPTAASDCFEQAFAFFKHRNDLSIVADILNNQTAVGKLYASRGEVDKARQAYARTIHHYEEVRTRIPDPAQVGKFQDTFFNPYLSRALLEYQAQRMEDALLVADGGRGHGLVFQTSQQLALASLHGADAHAWQKAVERLTQRRRTLHKIEQDYLNAKADKDSSLLTKRNTLLASLNEAERSLVTLREDLKRRSPELARIYDDHSDLEKSRAAIRKLVRDNPDTLFLEFATVDDTTLLFALSQQDGLHAFTLSSTTHLKSLLADWKKALTALSTLETFPINRHAAITEFAATQRKKARDLSKELLSPLEDAGLLKPGRYARLVVIPDGPLLEVPFAALIDKQGRCLVDRYALSVDISLSLRSWRVSHGNPKGSLFCAADPIGSAETSLLRGGETFRHLAHARKEGKRIAAMFPGAKFLFGTAAKEAQIKKEIGRYRFLHFATHGVLDPSEGLWSWLLLAKDRQEDGRLEAREILSVPLKAEMAVLSACNTAQGSAHGGEGFQGLVWAFRGAGCPLVVGSLWKVQEVATEELMTTFYQGVKAGLRKDVALQRAMRAVRKKYPHPYYWAGFQMYGEDSSAPNLRKATP